MEGIDVNSVPGMPGIPGIPGAKNNIVVISPVRYIRITLITVHTQTNSILLHFVLMRLENWHLRALFGTGLISIKLYAVNPQSKVRKYKAH